MVMLVRCGAVLLLARHSKNKKGEGWGELPRDRPEGERERGSRVNKSGGYCGSASFAEAHGKYSRRLHFTPDIRAESIASTRGVCSYVPALKASLVRN